MHRVAPFLVKSVLIIHKVHSNLHLNCCSHHFLPPCLPAHHRTCQPRFLCFTTLIFDMVLGICLGLSIPSLLQASPSPAWPPACTELCSNERIFPCHSLTGISDLKEEQALQPGSAIPNFLLYHHHACPSQQKHGRKQLTAGMG